MVDFGHFLCLKNLKVNIRDTEFMFFFICKQGSSLFFKHKIGGKLSHNIVVSIFRKFLLVTYDEEKNKNRKKNRKSPDEMTSRVFIQIISWRLFAYGCL